MVWKLVTKDWNVQVFWFLASRRQQISVMQEWTIPWFSCHSSYQVMTSGGSKISQGASTLREGAKTYYLANFCQKTAWKWRNFFQRGTRPSRPVDPSLNNWQRSTTSPSQSNGLEKENETDTDNKYTEPNGNLCCHLPMCNTNTSYSTHFYLSGFWLRTNKNEIYAAFFLMT